MTQETYARIADIIDECSPWIQVHRQDVEMAMAALVGGTPQDQPCRMLTLAAVRRQGVYRKGQTWQIPLRKLASDLRKLRRKGGFGMELSPRLVEALVLRSSGGLLSLGMADLNI